jgi:dipeptidase E
MYQGAVPSACSFFFLEKNHFFLLIFPWQLPAVPVTFTVLTTGMTLNQQILALSSSRANGGAYLSAARTQILPFLGEGPRHIAFVPHAAVGTTHSEYRDRVAAAFDGLSYTFEVLEEANAQSLLHKCDAIMVGGGNTFRLLSELYSTGLLTRIGECVMAGKPYVGWSAGANLVGRSICTTNDMPIIQPQSFLAFRFFSFQVNPHYYNYQPPGFHGETRDQRLEEFCTLNPGIPVLALPEGSGLRLQHEVLWYEGEKEGVIFTGSHAGGVTRDALTPGADVSFLL